MGIVSILVGAFLFLVPGACLYVGYATDMGDL